MRLPNVHILHRSHLNEFIFSLIYFSKCHHKNVTIRMEEDDEMMKQRKFGTKIENTHSPSEQHQNHDSYKNKDHKCQTKSKKTNG